MPTNHKWPVQREVEPGPHRTQEDDRWEKVIIYSFVQKVPRTEPCWTVDDGDETLDLPGRVSTGSFYSERDICSRSALRHSYVCRAGEKKVAQAHERHRQSPQSVFPRLTIKGKVFHKTRLLPCNKHTRTHTHTITKQHTHREGKQNNNSKRTGRSALVYPRNLKGEIITPKVFLRH